MIDSMTNIFPVTVTKLRDPVTRAIKNISRALYGLALPILSSTRKHDVESLVDTLHDTLEKRSVDSVTDDPKRRKRLHHGYS